MTVHSFST